jgi:hypothetical protein
VAGLVRQSAAASTCPSIGTLHIDEKLLEEAKRACGAGTDAEAFAWGWRRSCGGRRTSTSVLVGGSQPGARAVARCRPSVEQWARARPLGRSPREREEVLRHDLVFGEMLMSAIAKGWIEVQPLASVVVDRLSLWTADPRLDALARDLGMAHRPVFQWLRRAPSVGGR